LAFSSGDPHRAQNAVVAPNPAFTGAADDWEVMSSERSTELKRSMRRAVVVILLDTTHSPRAMSRRLASPRRVETLVLSSTVLACADTGGNGDVQEPEATGGGDTTTAPGQPSASNSIGTSSGETAPSSPNVNPTGEPAGSSDTTDETPMASTSTTPDTTSAREEMTTSAGEETVDETDSESGGGTGSDSGSDTGDGETSVSAN